MPTRSSRADLAFAFAAALASWMLGCADAPPVVDRPNLVMIVADDLGWPDHGFMGSPHVETPNLDRLAEEGSVFRRGFATASICRPSLRSLLTGLHPIQWDAGASRMSRSGGRRTPIREFATLPRRLGSRGYASFQAGKFFEPSFGAAGFTDGTHREKGSEKFGSDGALTIGRTTMQPVFDFVDAHAEQPFFLFFAPMLPHVPHDAPDRFRKPYEGRGLSDPAVGYYANITRLDEVVGELVAHVEERGLGDRTLFVYLADNGWDQEPRREHPNRLPGYPGAGPRGKASMHELGYRTPIVLRWPGVIPAGEVRDELVSAVDLFPTLLDYAGAEPAPNRPGASLRPALEGAAWSRERVIEGTSWPVAPAKRPIPGRQTIFDHEPAWFLRTPHWRYVWYEAWGFDELYDVRVDERQETNVVDAHPELVAGFREEIETWRRDVRRPFAQGRSR